jgi:hypothetical protein
MANQSNIVRYLGCAALTSVMLLATACGSKMHLNTGIHLPPRGHATVSLTPESLNKVELKNQGPGIVHALAMDSANRVDADLMLGPGAHYADVMRGMSRITLRNLSQFETTVSIDLKQADGYQMRIDPPDDSR